MAGKNADTPMLYDGCRNSHAHAFPEAWREEEEKKVGNDYPCLLPLLFKVFHLLAPDGDGGSVSYTWGQ